MGNFPYLEVDMTTLSITKSASTDVISFKSNRPVKVSVVSENYTWIRASVDGEQVVLDWDENEWETSRQAVLTMSTTNNLFKKEIIIIQDASGELTIQGDLILRSKQEIADNSYTKVLGNLIIGNVTSIMSKASDGDVVTEMGDRIVIASPSDIDDNDIARLNDQIHLVEEKGIAIINTHAASVPVDLVKAVGAEILYLDNNQISELPAADVMASMGLKELSLAGNEISDVSALAECGTIEYLDISGNDVYDLEPLMQMAALDTIILTDLPLTQAQVDVFREQTGMEVVAESVRQDESPLPVFGALEITEVSDTEVIIKAKIENNATDVTKAGFYIGTDMTLASMTWYEAVCVDGTLTITYHPETLLNQVYFVRAYAENIVGGNYSKAGNFGSLFYEGDIFIKSATDVQTLIQNRYSHIEGSLLVGNITSSGSGIWLDDDKFHYCFEPSTLSDLSVLQQIAYVRDGLYIGNVGMGITSYISHISGMKTLWLRGNGIKSLPEMECDESLTSLDISMNAITDFSFLERMPALEKLYLGSSDFPSDETNSIGVLTGLETYTNLKYIDLSGLPIHEWQAKDLRVQMPDAEIVFSSGSQTPYIPTVVSRGVSRLEHKAVLRGCVSNSGKASVTEYGFYFSSDNVNFEKVPLGSSIEDGEVFTLDVAISDEAMYYFYPYAINAYGESRTSVSEFTLAYVDLSEKGTSNCYIVNNSGKYIFNASVKGCSVESVGTIESAEVLWETKNTTEAVTTGEIISSVSVSGNNVLFEVPSTMVPGNAVIAVKDAAGTILWSWHIWVTDYVPNETVQVYGGEYAMMDRNLGALNVNHGDVLSFGMFYQQGRKDPFVGCGDINAKEFAVTAPAGIITYQSGGSTAESIANPNIVLGSYDSRWSDEKNMYDPCPVGWKVPSSSAWSSFSTSYMSSVDYGLVFTSPASSPDAYYPLTGDTEMGKQTLRKPGSSGYMWTTSAGVAYNLLACSKESRSQYDENPVRCVKEIGFSVTTGNVDALSEVAVAYGNVRLVDETYIRERGFVFSSEYTEPTLDNSSSVKSGSGEGDFRANLNGLTPSTTYYVRAYANGDGIVNYGDVVTFTTLPSGSGDEFVEDDFYWE